VTTIDAAAAWQMKKSVTGAVLAAIIGLGLGGCETGGGLFAINSPDTQAGILPIAGQPAAAPQAQAQSAKIAIAPIIGAPEQVGAQLQAQLATNIEAQKITVAKAANDPAEFTLRGFVTSDREKTRTKVTYIWDVFDQTGRRVNRITGEEVVVTPQKEPWAAVSANVINTIATKVSASLSSWLPTQSAAAVASNVTQAGAGQVPATFAGAAAPAVAGSLQTAPGVAKPATPAPQKTAFVSQAAAPGGPTTGSIAREGPITAMVPNVIGAPGDGSVALTSALQRELTKSGITLSDRAAAQTYKVEGKVVVGQGANGKQPIQIDWNVWDAKGKKLGVVSQKNEVPQGSLDGAWGKVADAAAQAAVQGIVKLLPQPTSTN
jgi:hypothetical protein